MLFNNWSTWQTLLCVLICMVTFLLIRLTICLPCFACYKNIKLQSADKVSTMIVWGSGGHTTEMIFLLGKFPVKNFQPVHHVISQSDHTTMKKIKNSKIAIGDLGQWHQIIRSREVKQSWLSTIFTTSLSIFQCFFLVLRIRPKLLICNGPGTCVPVCFSAFLLRLLGLADTKIIFVESFCRVEKLSLTGKLLYNIVDRFIVQWPDLLLHYKRAEYLGDGHNSLENNKTK